MFLGGFRLMRIFAASCGDRRNVAQDILRGLTGARRASADVAGVILTDSLCGFVGAWGTG